MDEAKVTRSSSVNIHDHKDRNERPKAFHIALPNFLVQTPQRLHNFVKVNLNKLRDEGGANSILTKVKDSYRAALKPDADKQLEAWKDNPYWVDQPPEIKVSVPKGSLCNLNVKVQVGLPPDAIYDIVIDPDNRRVFKNIKEVISRKVLVDEGSRQVVELEQAALWRFLWWSGTISVHVLVDQNRDDHSMKFKQVKTGFMKRFEGCWRVEPLFVDEKVCFPLKPKTWAEYNSCTGGKGRIGSTVSLEQLIQPALVPPPPISWYLRGITSKTCEMLIYDLLAEAARIRGDFAAAKFALEPALSPSITDESLPDELVDIKARWAHHRRNTKRCKNSRRFSG